MSESQVAEIWQQRRDATDTTRQKEVRSEWERDYARLIHSSAFRRLQSKTQVLGLGESDFYRTRLTHSMEVAQIGVGIVRWLKHRHASQPELAGMLPEDALMSSICLAHDIGHPPFGHGGEVALNVCMRDFGGFEGNGQTLRILASLDKYTEQHGLNPTRRLLLGVLKYPAPYSLTVCPDAYGTLPAQKWLFQSKQQHPPKCYLDSEIEVVEWILAPLSALEKEAFTRVQEPNPSSKAKHQKTAFKALDTSIMELADDISYSLHDLEDAISLGLIRRADWDTYIQPEYFLDCRHELPPELNIETIAEALFAEQSYRRKKMIGSLVHFFITQTRLQETQLTNASSPLIRWNAVLPEAAMRLLQHIFGLVLDRVIFSSNVQQLEFKGQRIIIELFDAFSSDPYRLLPDSTAQRYKKAAQSDQAECSQKRVICDYIAGMSDDYATRLYEKMYYPHKGSVFDRI